MEWIEYKLSDVIDIIGGGTPKRNIKEYWGGNIPWLSIVDFNNDARFIHDAQEKITDIGLRNSSTRLLDAGQLIISARGTVGCLAQVAKPMAFNQSCYGLSGKACIINGFLYYLIKYNLAKLKQNVHGAVFDTITRETFNYISVSLPSIDTQRQIEKILGDLDLKITINQQINQTLEAIAQALFKSWFVDFEPTRAKMAALEADRSEEDANISAMSAISGKSTEDLAMLKTANPKAYTELHATAALFPSRLVESELGEIPEGWEVKGLDGIATYLNGLALQKFRPPDERHYLPVLKIAQLKKGLADGEEKASLNIRPEYIVENGDVIFSWSGSLIVDIWCGGKAALNQHLFKVTSRYYPKWLYYYYTLHHLAEFQSIAADKAVTMGHIKREHLTQAMCAVPLIDSPFMKMADLILGGNLSEQVRLRLESRALTELRDSLLPKLLSGEIPVDATHLNVERCI